MNYLETNPEGVDATIKSVQEELHPRLTAIWAGEINGFGKIRKNERDGSVIPEWHLGDGEFKPVRYNDNYPGHFFFVVGDNHSTSDEMVYTAPTKLVFMVKLDQILPDETGNLDSLVHKQVVTILRDISDDRYSIEGIEVGVDNVLKGMKTSDLHFMLPKYCFAIKLKVNYYINC